MTKSNRYGRLTVSDIAEALHYLPQFSDRSYEELLRSVRHIAYQTRGLGHSVRSDGRGMKTYAPDAVFRALSILLAGSFTSRPRAADRLNYLSLREAVSGVMKGQRWFMIVRPASHIEFTRDAVLQTGTAYIDVTEMFSALRRYATDDTTAASEQPLRETQ